MSWRAVFVGPHPRGPYWRSVNLKDAAHNSAIRKHVALPIVGRAVVVVVPGGVVTTVVGADVWTAKSAFRVVNPQMSATIGTDLELLGQELRRAPIEVHVDAILILRRLIGEIVGETEHAREFVPGLRIEIGADLEFIRSARDYCRRSAKLTLQRQICEWQSALPRRNPRKARSCTRPNSLARLWHDQGKSQQAREMLAPVYGWFAEGFDTRNLKEAKALLDALTA